MQENKEDKAILSQKDTPPEYAKSAEIYIRKSSGLVKAISPYGAIIANLIGIGIFVNTFWIVFASALYPNADLVATVPIGFVVSLLVAYVYWVLSSAMPRTGGDYIYVSRIIHPSLGFVTNFMFVILMVTWVGLFPSWIPTYALQIMFSNLSLVTGNSYYANVASWLTTQSAEFMIAALILALIIIIMMLPTKWVLRIVVATFVAQLIIYLAFVGFLALTPHLAFVNSFTKSGTSVNQIINAAESQGVSMRITAAGTVTGIVYTVLSFIGYQNSAYYAGEIRGDPRKSQGIAIFLSLIIFAFLTYILYFEMYKVFGRDFLIASSSLWATGNSAWTNYITTMPSPTYLISYLSNNPLFVAAMPFGIVLTFFGFALVYYFIPVRQLFAWSFDRILPTRLAEVSSKGVPWVAVLLFAAIAYLSLYLTIYTTVFSYFAYSNFGWWIAWAIVMFVAAIFPFKRKDLFESSPPIVRVKIGLVPLITIVGVAAGVFSLFISYFSILPAYTGAPLNPVYVASILIVFVIAAIIYGISYTYHKSKGIPIELIAKELPPE